MCKSSIQSTSWLLTSVFKHTHTHNLVCSHMRVLYGFSKGRRHKHKRCGNKHTHTRLLWKCVGWMWMWNVTAVIKGLIFHMAIHQRCSTNDDNANTHTHKQAHSYTPRETQVFSIMEMRASARTQNMSSTKGRNTVTCIHMRALKYAQLGPHVY